MSETLQQLADTLCRGFCAWNLQHDRRTLMQLGCGKLEVDLLKKTCRFERDYIPRLAIMNTLLGQLQRFLEDNEVAPEIIRSATLLIEITIEEREEQRDKSVMWFGECDGFVECDMGIRCTIDAENKDYKSEHRGRVEWPRRSGGSVS
jgi:hypothetical protein